MIKFKYPVLITKIDNNTKKITIPDLRTQITVGEKKLKNIGLINYIRNKITSYIFEINSKDKKINFPKTLDEYKNIVLEKDEFWIEVEVEVDIKQRKGTFERSFPIIGLLSRIVTMALYAVMAMFATELSMGDHNKTRGRSLAISGAFCAFFMAMLRFIFSNAMKTVAGIGKKIDDTILKLTHRSTADDTSNISVFNDDSRFNNLFHKNSTVKILRALSILTLGGLSIIDSVSFGNTSAQSFNTIVNAVNKNDRYGQIPDIVIWAVAIIMGIAATLSGFSFDIGFSMSAVDLINKWFNNHYLKNENTVPINRMKFLDSHSINLESDESALLQNAIN